MSFCTQPTVAANSAVEAPITVTTESAKGASSKSGLIRATRNTPAVTMVAAWISAETGVGPSIASGSQVCRKSCADLPIAPMNSSTPQSSTALTVMPATSTVRPVSAGTAAKIASNATLSVSM